MEKNFITLTEVRKRFMAGELLDIVFGTHDESRKTGGNRQELLQVMLTTITTNQVSPKNKNLVSSDIESKNPNHNMNGTFNVRLKNGDIQKVRWILLEYVNEKPVVL